MKKIMISGNEIELKLESGNVTGKYHYTKDGLFYLTAHSCYDLSELMKYKDEIKKEVEGE